MERERDTSPSHGGGTLAEAISETAKTTEIVPSRREAGLMKIGVPKEIHKDETRVALTPGSARSFADRGFQVLVESGAGQLSSFTDASYEAAGVRVVPDARSLWGEADLVLKVRGPEPHPDLGVHEAELLKPGGHLISFIWPAENPELLDMLSDKKATVMAMDCVPRTTRAQKLDALSSMGNISGYRAVIEAAHHFGRFFNGQITAAGKVPPAKVLVIGAGVAGLAAIGAAKGLGAIVRAFDTRPVAKEQVESMGAEFLQVEVEEDGTGTGGYAKVMSKEFIEAEMKLFAEQAAEVDIIITTALIPGRTAPVLITKAMVESMKDGSVIVDLAAEKGGNCEVTECGKVVVHDGVSVIGYENLATRLPNQSSVLYATNLDRLIAELAPNGGGTLQLDMDDEIVRGMTVMKDGEITWPPPPIEPSPAPGTGPAQKKPAAGGAAPAAAPKAAPAPEKKVEPAPSNVPSDTSAAPAPKKKLPVPMILGAVLFALLGAAAPLEFLAHFTVFVLAIFVGYMVVWNVSPALHTPLMAVTNAISGIIVIGALLLISDTSSPLVMILAFVATFFATINVFGGFHVTQRMLQMFRK